MAIFFLLFVHRFFTSLLHWTLQMVYPALSLGLLWGRNGRSDQVPEGSVLSLLVWVVPGLAFPEAAPGTCGTSYVPDAGLHGPGLASVLSTPKTASPSQASLDSLHHSVTPHQGVQNLPDPLITRLLMLAQDLGISLSQTCITALVPC